MFTHYSRGILPLGALASEDKGSLLDFLKCNSNRLRQRHCAIGNTETSVFQVLSSLRQGVGNIA